MDLNLIFGYHLRHYRATNNIGQRKMAELLNSNQSSISYIEQGMNKTHDLNLIKTVTELTGKTFEQLMQPLTPEEMAELDRMTRTISRPLIAQENRVRHWPKKMFIGSRIEMREMIRQDGFHPRVDLFKTTEEVLNFMAGPPCDVYEVYTASLFRRFMEKIEHPHWTLYNYHEHISPDKILGMVTYREE